MRGLLYVLFLGVLARTWVRSYEREFDFNSLFGCAAFTSDGIGNQNVLIGSYSDSTNEVLCFQEAYSPGLVSYSSSINSATIGSQIWMTKNLEVQTFKNGDLIPHAKTKEQWEKAAKDKQPAWCYYENNPENGKKYGKLYNWYAVADPRGLAPQGWHIPTDYEWTILVDYLEDNAGEKMKESTSYEIKTSFREVDGYYEKKWVECSSCSYWTSIQKKNNPCTKCKNQRGWYLKTGKYVPAKKEKVEQKIPVGWNGTNLSGWSGLPGGSRGDSFRGIKGHPEFVYGKWWTISDLSSQNKALSRALFENGEYCTRHFSFKSMGFSVRCIKD